MAEYNKFQYSKFIGTNREEQLVVRADTYAELTLLCLEAGITLPRPQHPVVSRPEQVEPPHPVMQLPQYAQPTEDLGVCKKCGAPMVHNPKTGKNFCKEKCWLKGQQ